MTWRPNGIVSAHADEFPVWCQVGTGGNIFDLSEEELQGFFERMGLRISKLALQVLYKDGRVVESGSRVFNLVKVPLWRIGFIEHTHDVEAILTAANRHGLRECLPEMVLPLLVSYRHLMERPKVTIGMRPLPVLGKQRVLALGCGHKGECLYALDVAAQPSDVHNWKPKDTELWNPNDLFVFDLNLV